MKLSFLVGVLVEFERAKAQQFFDDVIWTMPGKFANMSSCEKE